MPRKPPHCHASATPGQWSAALRVQNPGGSHVGVDSVVAGACAATPVDLVPPAEVQLLHVDKTPLLADPYMFSWQPVTLDRDGNPETLGHYELSRSLDPRSVTGAWIVEPSTSHPWRPSVDGGSALLFFLVRARDAAGTRMISAGEAIRSGPADRGRSARPQVS